MADWRSGVNCVQVATLLSAAFSFPLSEEERPPIEIIKQINTVNDDGSYTFGYESADGTFKVETRDATGRVKGRFGYVDENGNLKMVEYSTDDEGGFVAQGDHLPIQSSPGQPIPAKEALTNVLSPKEPIPAEQKPFETNRATEEKPRARELHEQILPEEIEASHVQALQSLFQEQLDDTEISLLERQVEKQQKLGLQETPSLPPSMGIA